jgi:SAM-dependent methyltransferase
MNALTAAANPAEAPHSKRGRRGRLSLLLLLASHGQDPAQMLVRLALRQALRDCDSVLDIGCGLSRDLRWLGVPSTTGMDAYQPGLEEAIRLRTHDHFVLGDARRVGHYFKPGQFDAVIAMDVIEHFTKTDGLLVLRSMDELARKKVVLFTPSGFLPQSHAEEADLQPHLSGWEPADMERLGYRVTGMLGPKGLRGESHRLKGRPRLFWGGLSLLAHLLWTRRAPVRAAALFCVKTKTGVAS